MANKNFQNYAIAGNNVALTYDNVNDTVTFDVNVDKNDVGLGNVDNTSDIDKPISTLVQNALNLKQDAITLTTTGSSGASTFAANVLNIPTYTLSGLGGQPLATNLTSISALTFVSTSFVKMTAAGTFALDTNTYLTAESDTLASVTGRGNSTTNAITVGNTTINGTIQNTIGTASLFTSNIIGGGTITFHIGTPTASNYFFRCDGVNTGFNAPNSAGFLYFRVGNTSFGQFHLTTGNFTLQNGGTFTDNGFRLDVNGTARIQNQLTTTGSITAASAIARGVYMNNTLVAAANGDVLVGLDINPTFTVGAFTGTTSLALRVTGNALFITPSVSDLNIQSSGSQPGIVFLQSGGASRASIKINGGSQEQFNFISTVNGGLFNWFTNSTTQIAKLWSTGNLTLQNGGTFTDAGFRLDVNGTARIQGTTTITPTAVTGALTTSSLDIAQTWNTTGTPIAIKLNVTDTASGNLSDLLQLQVGGSPRFRILKSGFFTHSSGGEISGGVVIGGATINTSSILEARSLTLGFLPPRMNTTQKNAIATPPSGLIVYDNTLGKLCVRGASTWETITSI